MLWMWRSSSLSSLRVLLALRARCDHVLTSLIKKRSTLHVLPILSARRGCPHSQPQSATVEGVRLNLVRDLHFAYWASRRLVREPVISGV